ncbi:MAG: hypothetical protein AAF718_00020 [Pseudomonadota bacterium]
MQGHKQLILNATVIEAMARQAECAFAMVNCVALKILDKIDVFLNQKAGGLLLGREELVGELSAQNVLKLYEAAFDLIFGYVATFDAKEKHVDIVHYPIEFRFDDLEY